MSKRATSRKSKRREAPAHPPYVVFISHSSSDRWIARKIAEEVEASVAQPWLDEKDLEGGDVVEEEIIRGIDACHETIVLVSPKSVKSQWVVYEIGAVRGQHKRVTPILHYVSPDAVAPIKGMKAIDLNEFDKFLIELKRRIDESGRGKK